MKPRLTVPKEALFAVHCGNALTAESPCWDGRTNIIWWIDIQGQRLLGKSLESGDELVFNLPAMPGLVALRRAGGLVLGLEDGLYPFDIECGLGDRIVAVEADDPRTRLNDGKPDIAGRLWFGSMDKTGSGEPIGNLYRLDTNGSITTARSQVSIPNAISFSPSGDRFYFADSRSQMVQVFDYDLDTGRPSSPHTYATYSGIEMPDGACVDADGSVWIAVVNGARVERRLPDGTLDTIIDLPVSRPTMPVLGGVDGRTLLLTSQRRNLTAAQLKSQPLAGDLIGVRVDVPAEGQCYVGY